MSQDILNSIIIPADNAVAVRIKVVPNASRTKIVGILGDRLKISIAAPPEAGKANKMLEALLAKTFNIPKKHVTVVAGHTQPQKRIEIQGLTPQQITATIAKLI
ncbi:YggU family protein [Planctomycetota bacterium]|nr:YggU family protein [Planctomycetota bacterium]